MSTDVESYRQALLAALRLRDVPGARIADALAEVDSHVAESGEDPEEAFGPPGEYAATVADALDPDRPRGWRGVLAALRGWTMWGSLAGGFLVADGAFDLGAGSESVFGLPAAVAFVAGALLLALVAVRLWRERDRVLDPRTGEDVVGPMPLWVGAVLVGMPVLTLVGLYVAGRLVA
jgi:hypothetical protein